MSDEQAAAPKYSRGEVVIYLDHHKRRQTGEVQNIEAKWPGYSAPKTPPYFIYSVSHPSYKNRVHYCGDDNILGLAQ